MTVLSSSLYCFNSVNRLWRKTKASSQLWVCTMQLWEADSCTVSFLWSHHDSDHIIKSSFFYFYQKCTWSYTFLHILVRVLDSERGIKRLESRVNLVGKEKNTRQSLSSDPCTTLRGAVLTDKRPGSDTLSWKPVSRTASLHPFSWMSESRRAGLRSTVTDTDDGGYWSSGSHRPEQLSEESAGR